MPNDADGRTWAARWLDLVDGAPSFPEPALRRGADYAAFDWQLDVEIEPGTAKTTASSGRRMHYDATITVPTLTLDETDDIVAFIAEKTERIAAVLDGELPLDLPHLVTFAADQIVPGCTCQSVDQPCKHAAAVVQLLADAVADDPFDLLHLRGLPRTDLVAKLTERRRQQQPDEDHAATAEPTPTASEVDGADVSPSSSEPTLRFAAATGALPPDPPRPELPRRLPPFPTPPPAGASFTEQGLRLLADDGARRAAELLRDGTHDWTDLDATTDLARRAADLEADADEVSASREVWKGLVERAQVTSQELRARAVAWRAGGPAAVSAHIAPIEIRTDPDDPSRQWRRSGDDTWVRFDKIKGRWLATGIVGRASVDPVPPVERPSDGRQ